jgi:pimeloyl-ACP methyl ester carboxylesterase
MYREEIAPYTFLANRRPLTPDRPTLLLLHGAGQSALLWQKQLDGISWKGNILALDLPGHGRSKIKSRQHIPDYALAVNDFIQTAGLETVIMGGMSMGGAVAMQLMIDAPGRFAAGFLCNTGARLRVSPIVLDFLENHADAWLDAAYQFSVMDKNQTTELRQHHDHVNDCPTEVTADDFKACHHFDVMDSLDAISCPVLVLTADHDQITPHKYGHYLAAHIPHAQLTSITDAGHLSPMEKPEAVNRAVTTFLDQIFS